MYEVICTMFYPKNQITSCETTEDIDETVWLCRTYYSIARKIPPIALKRIIQKTLYCSLVILYDKEMSITISYKEGGNDIWQNL